MAYEQIITGALSGTGADVNAARQLKVTAETDVATNPGNVGAVRIFSEVDSGTVTGTADLKSPEVSADYRVRVGIDTLLFNDNFNATAQNTNKWSYTFATMTATQPGNGLLQFGTVQGTTSAHGAMMRTFQFMSIIGTAAVWHESEWGMYTAPLTPNEVFAIGVGLPVSAILPPTDGAWFQLTSSGLIGRVCYSGTFVDTGILVPFEDFVVGECSKFSIELASGEINWWKDDVLLGTTLTALSTGAPFQQEALPAFQMKYNTGVVSNTNTMRIANIVLSMADLGTNKLWSHQMVVQGQGGFLGINGQTQGKSQWWTNNTGPIAAAATNTTAIAGATTLGGLVAVLPTLAANSDGKFFSFLNPVATINITGRNFICTGVKVQGAISVVLNGGPVVYAYAIAFGHTALSLATAESASFATATAHAPRIAFVGFESYAASAAVGVIGQGANLDLTHSPIVIRPGEYIDLIARNIGTVTTVTGAITIGCSFLGYWE